VFEESLLPHLESLYGLAIRLTRDPDTAADLLQDAVLRAFERFGQLRVPGSARAWLAKILTTIFLNRYTRRTDEAAIAPEALAAPAYETPEERLLRLCDTAQVEAALAELPEDFRLTVLLADVEEMPLREIAVLCGCPIGTVASRLARARRMLRHRLGHLQGERESEA